MVAVSSDEGAPMPQTQHEETLNPAPVPQTQEADTNNLLDTANAADSSTPVVEKKEKETKEMGEEEDPSSTKTLELATELYNKGSKAIVDGAYVDAVDCLSRALETRVAHYGELAPECALYYYKYGCALLYKSQEEADPLVDVPKKESKNLDKDKCPSVGDNGSSKASASNAQESITSSNNEEVEEGAADKDLEDDNEGSDSDGDESAGDEDDSDLDLAWKMLDVARAIVEKCPEDSIEKVNTFSALGEVSMEREDFETSLNDYLKALSILERLVEPDNRRIIELNFRICLVLEVWSKIEEAISYCEKAITLCKSCLKRLTEDVKLTDLSKDTKSVNDSGTGASQDSVEGDAEENEKQVLSGILSELERKLEDLQQVTSTPNSAFTEIMKIVASKYASAEANTSGTASRLSSFSSSQMGAVEGGFDSPTVSTAATNGGSITHLGVVGRGVKRASLNPIVAEPPLKKPALDSSSEKDGSSISEVESAVQAADTANK